jgi:hypothetical protein
VVEPAAVKRMTILDCPDHPSSALALDAGVLCFACGRQVVETDLVMITVEPGAALLAEAKHEWAVNLGVAAFGVEAQATARGMVEEASDAPA